MRRAVALLSGGLDSTLAVKLILEQGIEVFALNFTSPFCTCNSGRKESGCKSGARLVAERFGIPIKVMVKGLDYIELVRNPRYGYGKGINPCVDCRIYMFTHARRYMEEIGASFVITGEVLGQRPMSQRRNTLKIIERESGLEGLVVRPLCARHLEPTIPEKSGLVDRERLLDMVGRTRKPQMELADQLDIHDYPCPSGGCLLTDKIFAKKVRDLLDHKREVTVKDLQILKTGRHFRFKGVKIVVSRNHMENIQLKNLLQEEDTLVEPLGFPGPVAVVNGALQDGTGEFVGGLILRYSNNKAGERRKIRATFRGVSQELEIKGSLPEEIIEETRVC